MQEWEANQEELDRQWYDDDETGQGRYSREGDDQFFVQGAQVENKQEEALRLKRLN